MDGRGKAATVRHQGKARKTGTRRGASGGAATRARVGYREELHTELADMLGGAPDVRQGSMFGFPAFYARGKLVACVYGRGIGLRVPADEATRIRGRATGGFEPYGKPMRSWAFLEPAHATDLRGEAPIIEAAVERAKAAAEAR